VVADAVAGRADALEQRPAARVARLLAAHEERRGDVRVG
jgi:hypothetical protein